MFLVSNTATTADKPTDVSSMYDLLLTFYATLLLDSYTNTYIGVTSHFDWGRGQRRSWLGGGNEFLFLPFSCGRQGGWEKCGLLYQFGMTILH